MKSLRYALGAFLIVACCTTEKPAPVAGPEPEAAPVEQVHGKPSAPVVIAVRFARDKVEVAHVSVTFESAGVVSIDARGVRGVVVSDGELVADRAVAAGERLTFDVTLAASEPTKGARESLFVVAVRGTFGGAERAKVQAFPVTRGAAAPVKTSTIDGTRVRITPAQTP